jgi:hypothetical protein
LLEFLPPPEKPKRLDRDWKKVEAEVGLALPEDYKQFIDHFGTGVIRGYRREVGELEVWNFRDSSFSRAFKGRVSVAIGVFEEVSDCPFPFYPEPGGLLPFASTRSGDYLNWRTEGPPDDWDVVGYGALRRELKLLKGHGFVRSLLDILTWKSRLIPDILKADAFTSPCEFVPQGS